MLTGNTIQLIQTGLRFLKHLDDDFLVQVLRELIRKGALLDLFLVNREGLVDEAAIGRHLGHSDRELVEFNFFCVLGGKLPSKL